MMTLQALCFIFIIIGSVYSKDIPDFIKLCHQGEPNLNECVLESVEGIRPHLKAGNPEYNIPSVEPIVIKDLMQEKSGGLNIECTDVIAYGGGDFIIKNLIVDTATRKFAVDILIPELKIESNYGVDGKLIMIPIKGNGKFYGNLTDCLTHYELLYEFVERDGERHLSFEKSKMKIKVGGGTVRLDNLFNGDKTLGDIINDTINKNIQPFVKEVMPYIEKGLSAYFMDVSNKIIEPYTADQLFPA